MKRLYALLLSSFLIGPFDSDGQDIPLFSQKLTNSFMYNPAVAGLNVGSLTYSYRSSYGKVNNAPKNNFLSVHTPVAGHKIGIGLNYYMEDVNFIRNNYASAAFAYHLRLSKANSLSFGIAGEYNFMGLSGTTNSDATDPVYENLLNGNSNKVDFSFGTVFNGRYVRAGFAANRLATTWLSKDSAAASGLFSGFIQGQIPLRGGNDLLEPYIAFRKLSETYDAYDIGLYYTYNSKIMAGGAVRKGSIASVTAGFYLTPRLFAGYSREMFFGEVRNQVGSTNEFTLRLDFIQYDYKSTFSSNYKSSLAYRRKTMANHKGSRSPAQLHRSQKKLASFSPNKRYQNVKKLSVIPSSQRYKVKSSKYKPPRKRKKGKR